MQSFSCKPFVCICKHTATRRGCPAEVRAEVGSSCYVFPGSRLCTGQDWSATIYPSIKNAVKNGSLAWGVINTCKQSPLSTRKLGASGDTFVGPGLRRHGRLPGGRLPSFPGAAQFKKKKSGHGHNIEIEIRLRRILLYLIKRRVRHCNSELQ